VGVLITPAGFVIVDWDLAELAPPERDLWQLADADCSVLAAYTEATRTMVDHRALAAFRMAYELADVAEFTCLLHGRHKDTEDAARSWEYLAYLLGRARRWPEMRA
jgi:hypothetical protein